MGIRIKNFKIYVSFPFVALITLMILNGFYVGYYLCFLSVLIHECGHLIAMLILKVNVSGLEISAFDIKIIEKGKSINSFKKEFIITSFGPLFNLTAFSAFLYLNKVFAFVNLFIGLFNLLPCSTLDGGQLLCLILSRRFSRKIVRRILNIATVVVFFPVFLTGIYILLSSRYNFSLLFLSLYLLMSLFVKNDKYL